MLRSCRKADKTQLCADGTRGEDTCQGDSGDPLMIKRRNEKEFVFEILGIVSFGMKGYAKKNEPEIYTRVTGYHK
ncbi:unnamed protein product [Didymodactylos carnosus]|uniref:Peptidase S1 domain-containing protein n=1 Tax=Didymodactylos carnosus TaxID=1234261 RepID=A0A815VDW7_9BILA|nr:unnamed protein product [Didymodactylos carnosus]CAF1526906.1 unnamed protein product [Didymodactylos carnosus]CAF4000339.1 unnamed protein product [Didymodactylos carnosus]CAF4386005.1 unnamed protein product [Didymodactylos carnosus]